MYIAACLGAITGRDSTAQHPTATVNPCPPAHPQRRLAARSDPSRLQVSIVAAAVWRPSAARLAAAAGVRFTAGCSRSAAHKLVAATHSCLLLLLLDSRRRSSALLLPLTAAIHCHGFSCVGCRRSRHRHHRHRCAAALAAVSYTGFAATRAAAAVIWGQPGQQQLLQQLVCHHLPQSGCQSSLLLLRNALLQPAQHLLQMGAGSGSQKNEL